jgi:ferritin-like metal-binding protein YciE
MSERLGRPSDSEWVRTLEAERDQLRQQVEKLLAETTRAVERLALADEEWGDDFEAEVRAVSQALTAAADQVRKELEGR